MTDNEIIKAIKELISQKEKNGCNDWHLVLSKGSANDLLRYINHLQISLEYKSEEIERLRKETSQTIESIRKLARDTIRDAKSEAIKEFAERLKKKAVQKYDWNEYVEIEDIDNLLKEMEGEE